MRYANLITEDCVNGEGICVSLFMQGCHFHCEGCQNPETWNFDGGKEINITDLIASIAQAINRNGIIRNFSVLGGEPLAPENIEQCYIIVNAIKEIFPNIKIFLWTGYEANELPTNASARALYPLLDKMIIGRFHIEERDITIPLAGSRNQKIINPKNLIYSKNCDIILLKEDE